MSNDEPCVVRFTTQIMHLSHNISQTVGLWELTLTCEPTKSTRGMKRDPDFQGHIQGQLECNWIL